MALKGKQDDITKIIYVKGIFKFKNLKFFKIWQIY